MRYLPPVAALVAFERAAEYLSFQKAADELCITPSAVSHRVKALEQFLGVQLFHRLNRKIVLTDAGVRYAHSICEALQKIEQATRQLTENGNNDSLIVQLPPSLATKWLLPNLPRFLEENPDCTVKVNATESPVSFGRSNVDIDIAICHTAPGGNAYVEELITERFLPLCSPSKWAAGPADIARIPLIKTERNPVSWKNWFETNQIAEYDLSVGMQFDPSTAAIQAAVAGLGIILESDILVAEELRNGQLICPFPEKVIPIERHYYLAYSRNAEQSTTIQLFIDWLRQLARKYENPATIPNRTEEVDSQGPT